ncbi:MAG: Ig-like domain-containing protein [Anditalea sp.]
MKLFSLKYIYLLILILIPSCAEPDIAMKDSLPKLELVTPIENMTGDWLEHHDFSAWNENEYWTWEEKNNAPPGINGKLNEFTVEVIVHDSEGNPVKDAIINFSPEAGKVNPSSTKTSPDGTATTLWKFDGAWYTWGNWDLTITGFNVDGITPLGGSPLTGQAVITAPPGI